MTKWFSRRWVWAALAGATVTVGAAGRVAADGPPKVGATVALNIDGKGERQFKVLKSEKQPDGTYHSELKDVQSGETITLVDKVGDPPAGPKAEPPKAPEPPKARPRTSDPLTPPVAATMPDPAKDKDKDKDKDKRPIVGRVFGDKDKAAGLPSATAAPAPRAEEPAKKPGLLGRIFGPKKPTGPSMAGAATVPVGAPAGAVPRPGTAASPPPVLPVPPGGLGATAPATVPVPPAPPSGGAEPPRVMPAKPVTPPTPVVSAPLPVPLPAFPTPAPSPVVAPPVAAPAPAPVPAPPVAAPVPALPVAVPVPAPPVAAPVPVPTPALPVPSIPVPPAGAGLPPIPVPPGGAAAKPLQVVVPAGFVPAGVAFDREVQPFVIALQSMSAPSARLTAAQGLAEGRHGSTDGVKGALFQAAQMDPCGEVRAACIEHLCKLGYYSPQFLGYIQTASDDTDPAVRDAARAACGKMLRK